MLFLSVDVPVPSQQYTDPWASEKSIEALAKVADLNGDGKIDYNEFLHRLGESTAYTDDKHRFDGRGVAKAVKKSGGMGILGPRTTTRKFEANTNTEWDGIKLVSKLREAMYRKGGVAIDLFRKIDADASGYIDAAELEKGIQSLTGLIGDIEPAELTQLIDFLDRDSDGVLFFDEFAKHVLPSEATGISVHSQKRSVIKAMPTRLLKLSAPEILASLERPPDVMHSTRFGATPRDIYDTPSWVPSESMNAESSSRFVRKEHWSSREFDSKKKTGLRRNEHSQAMFTQRSTQSNDVSPETGRIKSIARQREIYEMNLKKDTNRKPKINRKRYVSPSKAYFEHGTLNIFRQ